MLNMQATRQFSSALFAGALICTTAACEVAPDDMASEDLASEDVASAAEALTYDPTSETFQESLRRQVTRGNDKPFSFRVKQGSTVSASITRMNSYNTQFKLLFLQSEFAPQPTWEQATTACLAGTGTGNPSSCTETATGPYGLIIARAVNDTNPGDFTLEYEFEGPCAGQSCYLTHGITVTKLSQTPKKPLVDPANGTLPGLMAGHSATLALTRSHANVVIENGPKFKDLANADLAGIDCTQWTKSTPSKTFNDVMSCTITAGKDGNIHVPFKTTNTTTTGRWGKLLISRNGEYITDKTASVSH